MTDVLTTTTGMCRQCGRLLPAQVVLHDGAVWFHKECPAHGPQKAMVWSDAANYISLSSIHRPAEVPVQFTAPRSKGCPQDCGLCPDHEQHVCMPILEITDHCDLRCPVCLVRNEATYHLTPLQVARILDRLIASEGHIDVMTLSGGEPTRNPHFHDIVKECVSRPEIARVSISTNGLALLDSPDLLKALADTNVVVSLQFDGLSEEPYTRLRGQPLLDRKKRLLDRLGQLDIPTSLTMTVGRDINEDRVSDLVSLLFERDHVLSVMFQPVAYVGTAFHMPQPERRVTIPDVVRRLDGAGGGAVSMDDFVPLPCSHPACFSLSFYLRAEGGSFVPMKRFVETGKYVDIIRNRALFGADAERLELVRDAVYDLWSGPSGLTPDSRKALHAVKRILNLLSCCEPYDPARVVAATERSIKSVFIHQFMDRDTFDLARARKCCNVYPRPDGRLVPACVYNCLGRSNR